MFKAAAVYSSYLTFIIYLVSDKNFSNWNMWKSLGTFNFNNGRLSTLGFYNIFNVTWSINVNC